MSAKKSKNAKRAKQPIAVAQEVLAPKKRTGLSRFEKLFIREYLDCFDVGKAAEEAGARTPEGCTERQRRYRLDRTGRRVMRRRAVGDEVERRLTDSLRGLGVEKGKVLAELCHIAFFRAGKLFAPDGSPIQINELDDATQAAIAGIELEERYEGHGEDRIFVGYVRKYKIINKTEPLKLLGSHLKLFLEKEQESGGTDRLQELVDAMRRPVNDGAKPTPVAPLLEGEIVEPSSQH